MAGIASVRTITEARAILNREAKGMKITSDDGEYRVYNSTIPEKRQEPCAYYTNDLTDAVNTAIVMFQKGAW